MKIAINARYLTSPYSGIGQYTINLLESLAKVDKENEYTLIVPWPVDFSFGPNFKIVDVREAKWFGDDYYSRLWWEQITLGRYLKKLKPDIYHSLYQSLPLNANKYASIVTIHDTIPWKFPWQRSNAQYRRYSDISRWSCRKATKVICVSETAKLEVAPTYGIKPEEIEVIYEGVSDIFSKKPRVAKLEKIRQRFKLEKPFLLYVGGFKRHKNLRFMIKAYANAICRHKLDVDLVIPGKIRAHSGNAKELFYDPQMLMVYVKQKKLSKRVHFIGYARQDELVCLDYLCKAFISLSLYEGFGLPAIEAMAAKKPIIASDAGAYPEVIGNAGVLVYPYGLNRVADAINQVVTNKTLRERLVKNGEKRILLFNKEVLAKRLLDLYKQVKATQLSN